jgi:hypothetical protein
MEGMTMFKISIKRVIIWFAFLGCVIAAFSSLGHLPIEGIYNAKVAAAMSTMDVTLFKTSIFLFFILIGLGLFLELDYFKIKSKIPLLGSKKTLPHIGGWIVIVIVATLLMYAPMHFASDNYKNAIKQYNQEELRKARK